MTVMAFHNVMGERNATLKVQRGFMLAYRDSVRAAEHSYAASLQEGVSCVTPSARRYFSADQFWE